MGLFDLVGSAALDAARQTAVFTYERHKVLADNVANIDTPGYRARDLSTARFNELLDRALERANRRRPNTARLEGATIGEAPSKEGGLFQNLVFHDDNNRNIEQLMVAMLENATIQSQVMGSIRTQNNLLRAVISENVAS